MADQDDLQDKIVQLMRAIQARLAESPPASESNALKTSYSNLQDALDELALQSVTDASRDVAAAAGDLQKIVDSIPGRSLGGVIQEALNDLKKTRVIPGSPVTVGGSPAAPRPQPAPGVPQPRPGQPIQPAAGADGKSGQFVQNAVQIAQSEWDYFGRQEYDPHGHKTNPGHTEGEDPWFKRVGQYWLEGTGLPGIDGQDHNWYWSAAFVSWVMKKAGAGDRFRYSRKHSVYISLAIRDFDVKREAAGFWGERLNSCRPSVGDIVCWSREAGVDYDSQKGGDYDAHCDIIVAVDARYIWVIGGNVGNSVTKRPLPLDPQGFLLPTTQNGETLFAIMQDRIGSVQPVAVPVDGDIAVAAARQRSEAVAWGKAVDPAFKSRVLDIAQGLGCDPSHLLACMAFETKESFSPSIRNDSSGATGLIQFLPSTAAALDTTTDQLASLTAVDQLAFVEKYLSSYKGRMNSLSDVYMTILFPKAVGKPETFVLFASPEKAYLQNRPLDVNNDGVITKGESASKVQAQLDKGLSARFLG